MPLTIKPISDIFAISLDASLVTLPDIGDTYIWIADIKGVGSNDSLVAYWEERGFIRTSPTNAKTRDHDCDNMQLDGDLLDLRFLSGWNYVPMAWKPGPIDKYKDKLVLAFSTSLASPYYGLYRPATIVSSWNNVRYDTFTTMEGRLLCICTISLTDSWSAFYWDIQGDGYYTGKYALTYTLQHYSIVNNVTYWQSYNYQLVMRYKELSLDTVTNYLVPTITTKLKQIDWNNLTKYPRRTNSLNVYRSTGTPTDLAAVKEYYNVSSQEWLTSLERFSERRFDFGEMHYRAISKISVLDINGIAYAKDILTIFKSIKALLQTISGSISPKAFADLYLSMKYGAVLTVSDTKDLIASIKNVKKSGVSVTDITAAEGTYLKLTSTVRYTPMDDVFEDIYHFLRQWDLLLSPENLWDLIPFSFVVDWLFDVGNILTRLDKLEYINHLTINGVYDSYLAITQVPASRFMWGITGNINIRRYSRKCSLDASFPLIVPDQPTLTSHWLDGLALIIQRLAK